MSRKPLKKFGLAQTAIMTAVLAVYLMVAQLAGGPTALIDIVFGGAWSAITVLGLLVALSVIGALVYWGHRHTGALTQTILVVTLIVVALIVGVQWVNWSWSILWSLLLIVPLILGVMISVASAASAFGAPTRSPSETEPSRSSSLDDFLPA